MHVSNGTNAADMALMDRLHPFTDAGEIPLFFTLGGRKIRGIPPEFKPRVTHYTPDCNLMQTIITGENEQGLAIRAECTQYRDYPVVEWLAYLCNTGTADTPVLSDIQIFCAELRGENPVVIHGNGDTCKEDGYEFVTQPLREKLTLAPVDGTPCNGAFPYLRLLFNDYGINLVIGWPAQWQAVVEPTQQGVFFSAGQQHTGMYLKPGETVRTPRVTLMGFTGGQQRGRNLWRRWYFAHILPREDGQPLPPKLCLHTFGVDGKPEFTGITEENQIAGIDAYIRRDMKPDIWWIDAGWYPCLFDWPQTGTWIPNPDRLPRGFGPIGKKCEENGIRLLLWFEPERVRPGTWLDRERPQWLLHRRDETGCDARDRLLNLGDPSCCDWLIDHIDGMIKEGHIGVYRQDFNFPPLEYWRQNEGPGRVGYLENAHVQGYLRYWDELLRRNPGLWIDSCASGGRRNDLETMRRAVPLHYTDVGYGNHPIKQKQHRAMFEWIPYFRAHTMSWDNEEGTYENGGKPVDRYAYHCALAPAITSMIEYDDSDALFALGRALHPIWREAAKLMLSGDYYPLTECRKSSRDYYAMQFDDPASRRGFIQAVRNTQAEEDELTVYPFARDGAVYRFTDPETGRTRTHTGRELLDGFTVRIPKRSAVIWFYETEERL